MTFYETGIREMVTRGMPEVYAKIAMDKAVLESQSNPDSANESLKDRWLEQVEGYPPNMHVIIFIATQDAALEVIKEKCPGAFFRPMFDREHPLRKEFQSKQIKKE